MPTNDEKRKKEFREDIESFRVLQKANLLGELDGYRVRSQVSFSRASAVLGFTGIMLASDLVFLSAAPDTLLGLAKEQWRWVGGSALIADMLLAMAAVCSLFSFEFRSRRIMESDGEVLLQK